MGVEIDLLTCIYIKLRLYIIVACVYVTWLMHLFTWQNYTVKVLSPCLCVGRVWERGCVVGVTTFL